MKMYEYFCFTINLSTRPQFLSHLQHPHLYMVSVEEVAFRSFTLVEVIVVILSTK